MLPLSPSASLSDLLLDDKFPSPHFYLCQPQGLQIIQLVEADAPPPRQVSSDLDASSFASSSYYSSQYSESASSQSDDQSDDVCSSYCSSDVSPEELEAPASEHSKSSSPESTDTYSLRMKRILSWREDFYSQLQATLSESSSPSLKRKLDLCDEDEDDNASHSSKRSRYSQASSSDYCQSLMLVDTIAQPSPSSSLGMHSCPACDAFFDTPQTLRQHGRDAQANEACCAAVEYAFE